MYLEALMEKHLTFLEHLDELRRRIIISLAVLVIAAIGAFPFSSEFLKVLRLPAKGVIEKLAFFSPAEAFLVYMRVAFMLGWIISMPVILYQIWVFIAPALEEKYRKHISVFIVFCSISFAAGCLFAYFILLPPAIKFLLSFGKDELEPVISAAKFISFEIGLIVACGFVFQTPALSLLLTKTGLITPQMLRKKYKYALLAIFIIAAIITPTSDIFNMVILALPMIILYEISIWISFFSRPKYRKAAI